MPKPEKKRTGYYKEGSRHCMQVNDTAVGSGLARNPTWIWSFGNSYTVHCTTRPELNFLCIIWNTYTATRLRPGCAVIRKNIIIHQPGFTLQVLMCLGFLGI